MTNNTDPVRALADLAERAVPFLRDEAAKYDDDGSNEPLELAREIETALASLPSDESALSSANSAFDGGREAALASEPPIATVGVEGWALTKLRPHEARCDACGRAVWDGRDRDNCIGFLAPCGKRIARRGDCGTVDCLEALAQQPAACGTCREAIRPDALTGTICKCAQQPAAPSGEAVAEVVEFYGLRAVSWIGTGDAPGLPVGTKLYAAPQQPAGVGGVPQAWISDNDLLKLHESVDEARNIRMSVRRTHTRVHPIYIPALAALQGGRDDG